jgi:hypothetical protein
MPAEARRSDRDKRRSKFADKVRANTQQQKEARSSYGYLKLPKGVRMFQPKGGTRARVDFLPYVVTDKAHPDRKEDLKIATPGELWYKRPFRVHRGVGAEKQTLVCPSSFGRKCPICEYRSQRTKEGADRKETDVLKFSNRNLYCVVPIDDKEHEAEPHVFDVSQFLFQDLLNNEMEEDERFYGFFDPEVGYTLKIRFDEESFAGNKFAQASRIDFTERDKAYSEKELAKVPSLDDMLTVLPYKEIDQLFLELDPADEKGEDDDDGTPRQRVAPQKDEDEDDEPPPRKRSTRDDDDDDADEDPPAKPARRAARDEDEDEDEAPAPRKRKDADEDDDAEEDPPPRRRRAARDEDDDADDEPPAKAKPAKDEDEDEDDAPPPRRARSVKDEDDAEDEPAPRKRSKPAKDEDEDEPEEESEDDDDDAEDEPAPSRRRAAPARDEEEEDEEEEAPPAKKKAAPAAAKGKEECPAGHKFGVDTDEKKECDDCPLWEKCLDAKEARKK